MRTDCQTSSSHLISLKRPAALMLQIKILFLFWTSVTLNRMCFHSGGVRLNFKLTCLVRFSASGQGLQKTFTLTSAVTLRTQTLYCQTENIPNTNKANQNQKQPTPELKEHTKMDFIERKNNRNTKSTSDQIKMERRFKKQVKSRSVCVWVHPVQICASLKVFCGWFDRSRRRRRRSGSRRRRDGRVLHKPGIT